LEWF